MNKHRIRAHDPDSVRALQVTRAFSFTKTPKRVIQRAFMANCTPDEKNPRLSCENHACSSSTLAVSLFAPVLLFFSKTSTCMLTVGTGVLFYFSKSVFFNF